MKKYKTFETERLFLRPTQQEDADFILELMTSPKWLANIGNRGVNTREEASAYIRDKMLAQLQRLGFGNYTVIRKSDQARMGTCGLHDREGLNGVDIGYAFLERYEGNGYAFEAAQRLKQAAFEDFLFTDLWAITTHKNKASQHILEKLGMTHETNVFLANDPEELRLYHLKPE